MFVLECGLIPVVRTYTDRGEGYSSFDLLDNKDRVIGHRWVIQHVLNVPVSRPDYDAHVSNGYVRPDEPLEYYRVHCHVTRNGQHFGASHTDAKVQTLDEAHTVIAARRKTSLAYNSKKFSVFNRRAG